MSLTIELPERLERRLETEAKRAGVAPSAFVTQALEEKLQSSEPGLESLDDVQLVEIINRGLNPEEWERYRLLIDIRQQEALSNNERDEFLQFADRLEALNAQRLEALSTLALRRGTTLTGLMRELGIPLAQDA